MAEAADRETARTYDRLAELPVVVDGWSLDRHERETSSGFARVTTEIVLAGDGHEGRGEDVTYAVDAHDAFLDDPPACPLGGPATLGGASASLDEDRFPVDPAERGAERSYRRWAVESALLDLALRQAETDLARVLDRPRSPVRFVVSTSLGEPPTAGPVEAWLDAVPSLEFKVDATRAWSDETLAALVETGRIRTIDLKGHYADDADDGAEAESWEGRPDPDAYRRLLAAFPDTVFEDPGVTEATRPVLEPHRDRLSWDAPVHSVADFEALPLSPQWCNVKPSRFATLERLFDFLDSAEATGLRLYGGGQFELSVGRGQLHELASLYSPDGPNDVAPRAYNDPDPRPGLPTSPLTPPEPSPGFGWTRA